MSIMFSASPRGTLGLEWELALVDNETRELLNIAPKLLAAQENLFPSTKFPHITGELLENTLELVSSPHARVSDATTELKQLAISANQLAATHGAALLGAGGHPFSRWYDQTVSGGDRYARFIDKYRWWGRNMLIWGVHMHIGVDRQDRVVPLMHALLTHLPHLLALSSSSPFWAGENTGYLSNRTLRFQQLPTAGLPWEVDNWADVERVLTDLAKTGIIAEPTEARWDIRPAPRWGTLEIRFCDSASTLKEIAALAALAQCLCEYYQRGADNGETLPRLKPWFVRENKWRAARYGLDTAVIVDNDGTEKSLRSELAELVAKLTPLAAELGCETELAGVTEIMQFGTSAERQLRVFAAHGAEANSATALKAVVDSLTAEFAAGLT